MHASSPDSAAGISLWPPVILALITALVLAATVFATAPSTNVPTGPPGWRRWLGHLRYEVNAPKAWSVDDSWTTNISAIGAVLGAVAGTQGPLQPYIPNTGAFVAVSLLFGGSAVLAPIVYAALATSVGISDPGGGVSGALGTVGGLLLAAIFTLFAVFGEIYATLDIAIHDANQPLAQVAFWAGFVVAAILMALYAYRTLRGIILYPIPAPAAHTARSIAPSKLSPSRNASATL